MYVVLIGTRNRDITYTDIRRDTFEQITESLL